MFRVMLLICALASCVGCASDGDKGAWSEVMKDLRGDNMQMRGFGAEGFKPPK